MLSYFLFIYLQTPIPQLLFFYRPTHSERIGIGIGLPSHPARYCSKGRKKYTCNHQQKHRTKPKLALQSSEEAKIPIFRQLTDILLFFQFGKIVLFEPMSAIKYDNIIQSYQEFKFAAMLASIKKNGNKMKNSVVKATSATKRWIKKYRKRIIIIFLILLAIGLVVGLVLAAFQGVEITNYGVIINYTEERIHQGTYNNQVHLIGLNSKYYLVPKRKFLIYFDEAPPFEGAYWSPKLTARSQEGTKMIVSGRVSCSIVLPSEQIKSFLQQYGLDWKKYIIEKTRNSIIQNIGSTAFYEINNTLLLQKINSQFRSYSQIASYPFGLKLINLKIQYPPYSFSSNNSLGIRLLGQKSIYSQLVTNYESLNNKLTNNIAEIHQISARIGTLEASIRMIEMQVRSLDSNWMVGLQILNRLFEEDSDKMRRFLWVYFQRVYNSTYNNYTFY